MDLCSSLNKFKHNNLKILLSYPSSETHGRPISGGQLKLHLTLESAMNCLLPDGPPQKLGLRGS